MWKLLLVFGCLSSSVSGYLLSKSDPICRDESFLVYWKSNDPQVIKGDTQFDVTSDCHVEFQAWWELFIGLVFVIWIMQFLPAVINFIEGPDRRVKCCGEK